MQVWQVQGFKIIFAMKSSLSKLYFRFRRFICWSRQKLWFLWVMAAAQTAKNQGDEWDFTWYLQWGSVANKEIKLGRTFASAASTNKAGGTPPSESVRRQSPLRKFFRLCVALDWLKIGLNDNILLFFLNIYCCWIFLCNITFLWEYE